MRVFVDLDGVLADFDAGYEVVFGVKPPRALGLAEPPNFWDGLKQHPHFYRSLPLLPDAEALWDGVERAIGITPTILTGVPRSLPHADADKRAWVAQHFGATVPVICCPSKDKRNHGRPGDILIDDWDKYRPLWQEMGGTFILHTSASDSLRRLGAELGM